MGHDQKEQDRNKTETRQKQDKLDRTDRNWWDQARQDNKTKQDKDKTERRARLVEQLRLVVRRNPGTATCEVLWGLVLRL